MTGRWAFIGHGVLALALMGFAAACGADDDDDDTPLAGSGGAAAGAGGTSGSGTAGTTAGSGGSTAGTGGGAGMTAMVTPAMCAAASKVESPMTAAACIDCVCAKNAPVVDKLTAPGWRLIECIGVKCDGDGADLACITGAAPMGCADVTAAGGTEARTTSEIFPMCKTECGIGDMGGDDAGI